MVVASVLEPFSSDLLVLGVALAAWAGGWAGGLIALSVFPLALSFWPRVTVHEWIVCLIVVGVVAVARAKFETTFLESNERFRLIVRATSDAVWDFDYVTNHV